MPKITFVGAGSVVFARNLLGDILSFPELAESEIALMDIDAERLRIAEIMAHKVGEAALTRKREHIYQAAMLDPHTCAELTIDEIHSLVDDLIEAHGDMLPRYR